MFPLNVTTYIKLGVCAVLLGSFAYLGYSFEHNRFVAYQERVEAAGKAQETKNAEILKERELINKGVTDVYEARISSIHNFYSGLHNSGSGAVSNVPNATITINGNTINTLDFAEQCANTTQQLESLQDWIRNQVGLDK